VAFPRRLTGQALYNFIGGRRKINAKRQRAALSRRHQLQSVWANNLSWRRADLARYFGVSRTTITRDIAWLRENETTKDCLSCGHKLPGGLRGIDELICQSEMARLLGYLSHPVKFYNTKRRKAAEVDPYDATGIARDAADLARGDVDQPDLDDVDALYAAELSENNGNE